MREVFSILLLFVVACQPAPVVESAPVSPPAEPARDYGNIEFAPLTPAGPSRIFPLPPADAPLSLREMGDYMDSVSEEAVKVKWKLISHAPNYQDFQYVWNDGPPRVVFLFTGDGEAALRRYTVRPDFRSVTVNHSRDELEAGAKPVMDQLKAMGIHDFISGPDFIAGQQSLQLGITRAEFEKRDGAAAVLSSQTVELAFHQTIETEPSPLSPEMVSQIRHFPRLPAAESEAFMRIDIGNASGAIVLREGCFFVDLPGETDPLAVFQAYHAVKTDSEGHMIIYPQGQTDAYYRVRVGDIATWFGGNDVVSPFATGGTQLRGDHPIASVAYPLFEACGVHPVIVLDALDSLRNYDLNLQRGFTNFTQRKRACIDERVNAIQSARKIPDTPSTLPEDCGGL